MTAVEYGTAVVVANHDPSGVSMAELRGALDDLELTYADAMDRVPKLREFPVHVVFGSPHQTCPDRWEHSVARHVEVPL